MLYIETGSIPIKFIIKQRRLSYLHHILTRKDTELIKKVYIAQKRKPVKDDWFLTIKKDMDDINLNLSDAEIGEFKKEKF